MITTGSWYSRWPYSGAPFVLTTASALIYRNRQSHPTWGVALCGRSEYSLQCQQLQFPARCSSWEPQSAELQYIIQYIDKRQSLMWSTYLCGMCNMNCESLCMKKERKKERKKELAFGIGPCYDHNWALSSQHSQVMTSVDNYYIPLRPNKHATVNKKNKKTLSQFE